MPQTAKNWPSVKLICFGASMWMIPSEACVWSHMKHEPPLTKAPAVVFRPWSGGPMPIP